MSKFKVSLKITGFELEIEGSREELPLITQNIGQQLTNLLQPTTQVIEGEVTTPSNSQQQTVVTNSGERKPRRKRTVSSKVSTNDEEQAVDWLNDPTKWGTPQQSWNTANKALWILYVAEKEANVKEMTIARIVKTFNKHFKQAKLIQASNVTRDLGRLKITPNTPVSENSAMTPSTWFLTQEGYKQVENLIVQLRQPTQQ